MKLEKEISKGTEDTSVSMDAAMVSVKHGPPEKNAQETSDYFAHSEDVMVDNNHVVFDNSQKQTTLIKYNTPNTSIQDLSQFKDTFCYLSPSTKQLHENIEKATKSSEIVYNASKLKVVQKNIIESIDHILNHDLVCKNTMAAKYVAEMERKIQAIKEDFNKEVLSIVGSKNGKDNELCFPSFKNKKRKKVEK